MSKIAFLFPGQGSQSVGMGADAARLSPAAAALFEQANDIVGYDLRKLCFEGPEEELKQTENTQPALFIASMATLEVLREKGVSHCDAAAGHSLGEYSALCAAGSLDFETTLKLVRRRGEAFAEAGKARPGAMAAIIGLDAGKVEEVCAAASTGGEVAVPANYNDTSQIVISGDPAAIERACTAAKEAGAKRALPLPVSGAFHSPLVSPAADAMRDALAGVEIKTPACTFVNNVDAEVLADPTAIRDSLIRQVTGSVRWAQSIEKMIAEGVDTFVEVGSGKVLTGLVRRISRDSKGLTTESEGSIEATVAALKG